jgi:hypothetical protein
MRTAVLWVIERRVVVIFTDVSGQPVGPILKGQVVQKLSIRKYHYSLRNEPEQRSSHVYITYNFLCKWILQQPFGISKFIEL